MHYYTVSVLFDYKDFFLQPEMESCESFAELLHSTGNLHEMSYTDGSGLYMEMREPEPFARRASYHGNKKSEDLPS
jgi:hypothetical protein